MNICVQLHFGTNKSQVFMILSSRQVTMPLLTILKLQWFLSYTILIIFFLCCTISGNLIIPVVIVMRWYILRQELLHKMKELSIVV